MTGRNMVYLAGAVALCAISIPFGANAQTDQSARPPIYFDRLVVCKGIPQFIPIDDSSPIVWVDTKWDESRGNDFNVVWVEPNCGFLISNTDWATEDIIPPAIGIDNPADPHGLGRYLVSIHLLYSKYESERYSGVETSFSHILADNEKFDIHYYTDANMSVTFMPSEEIIVDDMKPEDILWLVSDSNMLDHLYKKYFPEINGCTRNCGSYQPLAEIHGGSLNGRVIYIVRLPLIEID